MTSPVSYTTKSFIMPMGIALLIMVQASMGLMMIPILLGLHFIFSMAVLLGGIFFCIALLSGVTVYSINEEGLSVQIRPLLPWKWWKYEKKKFYPWSSIHSYSIGEDMTRGMEKFHFIKVEIHGLANDLKISDNAKYFEGFEEFKAAFIQRVNERNQRFSQHKTFAGVPPSAATSGAASAGTPVQPPARGEKPIRRKPSFYESRLAKAVTVAFLIFIAGGLAFYVYHPQFLTWEHVVKISLVIVPGISYLFYKSFLEKRREGKFYREEKN